MRCESISVGVRFGDCLHVCATYRRPLEFQPIRKQTARTPQKHLLFLVMSMGAVTIITHCSVRCQGKQRASTEGALLVSRRPLALPDVSWQRASPEHKPGRDLSPTGNTRKELWCGNRHWETLCLIVQNVTKLTHFRKIRHKCLCALSPKQTPQQKYV